MDQEKDDHKKFVGYVYMISLVTQMFDFPKQCKSYVYEQGKFVSKFILT